MSTKKPQTNEALRAESLERLFEAGLDIFSTKGYKAATVEEIARTAHLTKGAVYFYYGSKEKFLLDLLQRIVKDYIDTPIDALNAPDRSAEEQLSQLIRVQTTYAASHPRQAKFLILMAIELQNDISEAAELIRDRYRRMRDTIEALIARGRACGEFTNTVGAREISSFHMSAFDGIIMEWSRRKNEIDGPTLVRVFRRALLAVLHE